MMTSRPQNRQSPEAQTRPGHLTAKAAISGLPLCVWVLCESEGSPRICTRRGPHKVTARTPAALWHIWGPRGGALNV